MTTRQRMIDVLTGIAHSDDQFTKDRIEAASIVLAHSYGDEDEQAPADDCSEGMCAGASLETGWFDTATPPPRKIVFGDVEVPVADPFPWLAAALNPVPVVKVKDLDGGIPGEKGHHTFAVSVNGAMVGSVCPACATEEGHFASRLHDIVTRAIARATT